MTLKKILAELVLIRKELQAIRSSQEFNVRVDGKAIYQVVQRAIHDKDADEMRMFEEREKIIS